MKNTEVRMEVVSETEAYEICKENGYKFIKVYWGKGNNSGNLMMLAERQNEVSEVKSLKNSEIRKYKYIFKATEGLYYTGNKGVNPYLEINAKVFELTKDAARQKALSMNKNSAYYWEEIKVKK